MENAWNAWKTIVTIHIFFFLKPYNGITIKNRVYNQCGDNQTN
jgi:hypothetical protein